MNVALAFLAVPPALALGSFLNVVAARLPERRSIVRPPSACDSAGRDGLARQHPCRLVPARPRPLPKLR